MRKIFDFLKNLLETIPAFLLFLVPVGGSILLVCFIVYSLIFPSAPSDQEIRDYAEMYREEWYGDGYSEGFEKGYEEGCDVGYDIGHEEGYTFASGKAMNYLDSIWDVLDDADAYGKDATMEKIAGLVEDAISELEDGS